MNAIELALEKQRLRLEIASQRVALSRHAEGLMPLFEAGDKLRAGARWATHHPEVVAGGVALLAAVRPGVRRFLWRWSKRAFVAWRLWNKGGFGPAKPAGRPSGHLNTQ